ncbi:heparinase II/III family protein [Caldibacillus lycopersici]|uniref:Heparinase II/III family protein n=1 Tax=Perspicuibacillus lycopersici TaxID=1325689 RepID=A0AAE3LM66_9BACI|nr:heparinase II/III family protein [Perspicuibacillus lycopersici]MCU9612626.1 heparinase II/III family protein [Perspicuibacillus lycopersici]
MDRLTIENLLENTKINRLSLLFSNGITKSEWLEKLRTSASYQPFVNEIKEEANNILEKPCQELSYTLFSLFRKTGSRLEFEKVYFAKRRRLNTFAFLTLLEPTNEQYVEELHNSIWSICNEYSWCLPAHLKNSPEISLQANYSLKRTFSEYSIDLFSAETAFTLSEIVTVMEDTLDPLLINRVKHEVHRRIFWPFIHQGKFGWETAMHNWASVCAGSIGAAAIYLLEDEGELSIVLERVLATMQYFLKGYKEDGACLEGYGYWEYGFGFFVYFADLMKKRTNGAINLFLNEKVHQIALFQQKNFLNGSSLVNFSDAQANGKVFIGLSHYLAKLYEDFEVPAITLRSTYTDDHCSRWAPAFRNLLWYNESLLGNSWRSATYYFKDSQWIISRTDTKYAFAAKGGHNGEPHNHNDLGQFILHGEQEVFLKDLGSGLYCDAYFGEERYTFICNGSQGHSVPIINDQFQRAGHHVEAMVKKVTLGGDAETFALEITKAYPVQSLNKLERNFTWRKGKKPSLYLIDTYVFSEEPKKVVERFILPPMTIEEHKEGIVVKGSESLLIQFDRKKVEMKINKMEFSNHFGEMESFIALDFILKSPAKKFDIAFSFTFIK